MRREDFKILFDQHFDSLRKYLYYRCGDTELSTDIAQEAFLKLWEKKLNKPPDELIGLLYKIAKDGLISSLRRQTLEMKFTSKPADNGNSITPEEELRYKELQLNYEKALNEMPEIQRVVFLMSRNEELKYHEIAERLDLSVKAVEKRMKNALQFLRQSLTVK
nr:sigma-70 family RNA polymerase sigma factor [uncultured Carboxylicivirga sp.]